MFECRLPCRVRNPSIPYWGNHRNPAITAELLRTLPKADLHCRLDGSVSLPTVWRAFLEAKLSLHSFGYTGENTYEVWPRRYTD